MAGIDLLSALSSVFPQRVEDFFLARMAADLQRELTGGLTDGFVEALLRGMAIAFALSRGYRRNIEGFDAVFVMRAKDDRVGASAVFQNGKMKVETQSRPVFDTRITFHDSEGLAKTLLSGNPDVLQTMLSSPVVVDGNLNCLYRFGFLAKELTLRLGIG